MNRPPKLVFVLGLNRQNIAVIPHSDQSIRQLAGLGLKQLVELQADLLLHLALLATDAS